MTNKPSKFYFWAKKSQNEPKSDKQAIFGLKNHKMSRKVTNNPPKFYFWVKKLQMGRKVTNNPSKFYFRLKITKRDKK